MRVDANQNNKKLCFKYGQKKIVLATQVAMK